jgi:hypothetical protein
MDRVGRDAVPRIPLREMPGLPARKARFGSPNGLLLAAEQGRTKYAREEED